MKHVVLDTSILRKSPRLDSPELKALAYLSRKRHLEIHIPYVVHREFVSYLAHDQRQRLQKGVNTLRSLARFDFSSDKTSTLLESIDWMEEVFESLVEERRKSFDRWIEDSNGTVHDLTLSESTLALEAYFEGTSPLKEPKTRNDIPESFIFQAVCSLKETHSDLLCIVVEDQKLRQACDEVGLETFNSLQALVSTDELRSALADKVIEDNQKSVNAIVYELVERAENRVLEKVEETLLGDDFRLISGDDIPGESGEIYVSSVNRPHSIDFGNVEHLGAGSFLCPFTGQVELLYEYAVHRSEIMELDNKKYYIEPLNDHYCNVETSDEFEFTGRVELDFGEGILRCENLESIKRELRDPAISVDEITDFELLNQVHNRHSST